MLALVTLSFPLLAAAASHAAGSAWTLCTADTRLDLAISDGSLQVTRLCAGDAGHNWVVHPVPIPLMGRVWVGGNEQSLQWAFRAGAWDEASSTLTLTFENKRPLMALRSLWRARPGRGPVEHWIEIDNGSDAPLTLSHQDSLSLLGIAPGAAAHVWWIKRGGGNASTQGGTFVEPLARNLDLNLVSNCDDGASPCPWLAVQVGEERGLYVGWEFSGLGRVQAKAVDENRVEIAVGNLPEFKTDIVPGETFLVPPAFVGCYDGDIDEGAYSLHQWFLQYLRPSVPDDVADPTLAYNLYLDAGGPNAKEADVLRSAAFCRDLGFETFMPDAMWFPACGDWRWDPARFPNGVKPIEEFVHGAGMKLALWCAWTNGGIAEDPDALSVRGPAGHPDWFEADYPPDWKPGPFYGGRVCLACREAREWEIRKTQWLAGNHKLDYLKHDCGPIVTHCNKTTHRHKHGVDASYWAAMGYYEVQEKLRQAFPRLILENCSGGGHIKDYGAMRRTHYTVTTDTLSNLPDRQSIYDSTFAFPPLVLQAYTYEREYKVPGDDPGSFLWRSAMMGAWQIDPTNTKIWTDEDRECARRNAEIYKTWIRPMLKDVKVHHILPRPDGRHWDGMFYWSPSLNRGTLYVFRPDAKEELQSIRLKGLDAAKEYWVWCEDGSVDPGVRAGGELMTAGLAITLPQRYTCDLVYVQDAALGKPAGLEPPGPFGLRHARILGGMFKAFGRIAWEPCPNARSYRVIVAECRNPAGVLYDQVVTHHVLSVDSLPPDADLYCKVEAIGYGGKRWNTGGPMMFHTSGLAIVTGVTFVSDMPWAKATAGADNTVHRDTNYHGKEIGIAAKKYPKGVWTHAFNDATPADLVLAIADKRFATFAADAGVEDSAGAGSVQFQVLVDGALKAESPVMRSGAVHRFKVDVTGAKKITLRVLNGDDGYACDHAAWGFARFIDTGAADPLSDGRLGMIPEPEREEMLYE